MVHPRRRLEYFQLFEPLDLVLEMARIIENQEIRLHLCILNVSLIK